MKPWPPDLGVRTVSYYTAQARLLRAQARNAALRNLLKLFATPVRYTAARFVTGRRTSSQNRNGIAAKWRAMMAPGHHARLKPPFRE